MIPATPPTERLEAQSFMVRPINEVPPVANDPQRLCTGCAGRIPLDQLHLCRECREAA